jgi:phage baseplate assembly protein W
MAFPPRVAPDGRIAWSEGETNIRESIQIILQTESGERLQMPAFGGGLRRFLFEPNTVATRHNIEERISRALAAWEPRISITDVTVDEDAQDRESAIATIEYKLVATQIKERVTLSIKLAA